MSAMASSRIGTRTDRLGLDPTINDHMTRVQLRLIREKLDRDREKDASFDSSPRGFGRSTPPTMDPHVAELHRAMLQRQELLNKIKREKELRDDLHRPRSYQDHHARQSPSPPPSRLSLPDVHRQRHRDGSRAGRGSRQVVEHQFGPMKLEPLANAPKPPSPQVIQTQVPQPYILNQPPAPITLQPIENRANTKGELMELMMMQNAQMHQMMMQQLMMSAIPKPAQNHDSSTSSKVALDLDDIITLKSEKKRPHSVHHHHYDQQHHQPQPLQQPYYPLPPVNMYPPQYPPYITPRNYYPTEVEPLKQPRARPRRKKHQSPVYRVTNGRHPFPGPLPLRRFRQAAYAVLFTRIVANAIKRGRGFKPDRRHRARWLDDDFLFGIRLKEAVAAMHKIYTNPDGKMRPVLLQVISETGRDLSLAMVDSSKKEHKDALDDLIYIVENVIYLMTDIMPTTGVLGTHRKAVVYDMIKNGKLFPRGYLWQIDKDKLQFDHSGRTHNVDDAAAFIMLIGIFLNRGLVSTLMIKAIEYGLVDRQLSYKAEKNIKVVATIFLYIGRKVFAAPKQPALAMPPELAHKLFSDEDMKVVLKKMKASIEYAEGLLRNWGSEYVKRLRAVV